MTKKTKTPLLTEVFLNESEGPYIDIKFIGDPGEDFKGQTVPIDKIVADRIVQEEIWAQTAWPKGEPTLADIIRKLPPPKEG